MDKIEKARLKLEKLQQKQKIEIGILAVKHGLHQFDLEKLDIAFALLAEELQE